jgi:hypothetical protein
MAFMQRPDEIAQFRPEDLLQGPRIERDHMHIEPSLAQCSSGFEADEA